MKIKEIPAPIHHDHKICPPTGIDTLPAGIVEKNLATMAKYKLLSLLCKLNPKDGPRSQTIYNLPDKLSLDMRSTNYSISATQDGNLWPSPRSRAIRAFMGGSNATI